MHKIHSKKIENQRCAPKSTYDSLYIKNIDNYCNSCKNPTNILIPEIKFYKEVEEIFFNEFNIDKKKHCFNKILISKKPLNINVLTKYEFYPRIILPKEGKKYTKFIQEKFKKLASNIVQEWANVVKKIELNNLENFQKSKGFSDMGLEIGKNILNNYYKFDKHTYKVLNSVKYFLKISSILSFKNLTTKTLRLYFYFLRNLRCYLVTKNYIDFEKNSSENLKFDIYLNEEMEKNWDSLMFLFLNLKRVEKYKEILIEEKMINFCFLEFITCFDDPILKYRLDEIMEIFYCFEMKKNLFLISEKKSGILKRQYDFVLKMYSIKALVDLKLQSKKFTQKLLENKDLEQRTKFLKEKLNLQIFKTEEKNQILTISESSEIPVQEITKIYNKKLEPVITNLEEIFDEFKEKNIENDPMFDCISLEKKHLVYPIKIDETMRETTRDLKNFRDKLNNEHQKLRQCHKLLQELRIQPIHSDEIGEEEQLKKYSCCEAVIEDLNLRPEFEFIDISDNFNEFYHLYMRYPCSVCGHTPRSSDFAMCLLCGEVMCIDTCAKMNKKHFGNLTNHTIQKHFSKGAFVCVTNGDCILFDTTRFHIFGNLYSDIFGLKYTQHSNKREISRKEFTLNHSIYKKMKDAFISGKVMNEIVQPQIVMESNDRNRLGVL